MAGITTKLRNLFKTQAANNGSRDLLDSILVPEIVEVLKVWAKHSTDCVLIGGAALSLYTKPRFTQDLDFLFLTDEQIPHSLEGFRRLRPHSFEHIDTGVEVEVLSAQFLKLPRSLVQQVIQTANLSNGIKVATPSALVALKLQRFSLQDKADIVALYGVAKIDLSEFSLSSAALIKLAILKQEENLG